MFLVILVLGVISITSARPDGLVPQNVITVPPNCPEGQEWVNGECRDIWKSGSKTPSPLLKLNGNNFDSKNMITVPPNCPPGQQMINGVCRDIWRGGALAESKLFEIFFEKLLAMYADIRDSKQAKTETKSEDIPETKDSFRNIISVPTQCPEGYRPDALGICREIF